MPETINTTVLLNLVPIQKPFHFLTIEQSSVSEQTTPQYISETITQASYSHPETDWFFIENVQSVFLFDYGWIVALSSKIDYSGVLLWKKGEQCLFFLLYYCRLFDFKKLWEYIHFLIFRNTKAVPILIV